MSTPHEPLEVALSRHGGEDQVIRARDWFRKATQGALEEFQKKVLDAEVGELDASAVEASLFITCSNALHDYRRVIFSLAASELTKKADEKPDDLF